MALPKHHTLSLLLKEQSMYLLRVNYMLIRTIVRESALSQSPEQLDRAGTLIIPMLQMKK